MFATDMSHNTPEASPRYSNCPSFLLKSKSQKQQLPQIPKLQMDKENEV